MRVTGGRLGGRKLFAPAVGVRPTADRVREALFARLGDLNGVQVLDLYAGTGALGIEALSRGAERAVFIEHSASSTAVLRRNLAALDLEGACRVMHTDASRALRRLSREKRRFELILADPPYADDAVAAHLELVVEGRLLAPDATLVVERGRRHPLPDVRGMVIVEERRYGDTLLLWLALDRPEAQGDSRS